jgi:glycine/D-amino acid oxidase-like deaminating enzyme
LRASEFLILGAGIQGICIALELAKKGKKVIILDQDHIPFNRASLRNEGKVHLGIVYMNDQTFATQKIMLRGALVFRKYLERWIGPKSYELGLSNPFNYLVAKDSFLSPAQLARKYQKLDYLFNEYTLQNPDWDYLGTKPEFISRQLSDQQTENLYGCEAVQGAFETTELSIDTEQLRNHLCDALLNNSLITFLPNHSVKKVSKQADLLKVSGLTLGEPFSYLTEHVINATWEGKFKLDHSFGIEKPQDLLHRLKYRVMVRIDKELINKPSATMVIGKYGDVVIRKDGTAYLSWYPAGCTDWSHKISPPLIWGKPSSGSVSIEKSAQLSAIFLQEIEKWFPGINKSTPYLVDAGTIVAYGKTDVDDDRSLLHDRTNIGLKSYNGNYHSIDTGKLTTAPLFAVETVDKILSDY